MESKVDTIKSDSEKVKELEKTVKELSTQVFMLQAAVDQLNFDHKKINFTVRQEIISCVANDKEVQAWIADAVEESMALIKSKIRKEMLEASDSI